MTNSCSFLPSESQNLLSLLLPTCSDPHGSPKQGSAKPGHALQAAPLGPGVPLSREGLLRKESMAGRGMEAKGRSRGDREAGAAKQPGEASGKGGRA